MKKKLIPIFIFLTISLLTIKCGSKKEEVNIAGKEAIVVYFCKDFDHDVKLRIKIKNESKPMEKTISKKCESHYFRDSVEKVSLIDKYDESIPIIDDNAKNTITTVKWGFLNLLEDDIGAAIYSDSHKNYPQECDCVPKKIDVQPGKLGQNIKVVYMQDM